MFSVHAPVRKPTPTAPAVDTRPTVLITEQEVQLLTAAGLTTVAAPRPSLLSRWIARAKAARVSAAAVDDRDRPRYVQKHYSYLESAAMSRAMERL
ncbi:MAG TPA: hypothetical protein VIJ23_03180 [Mycobacterium sp.]